MMPFLRLFAVALLLIALTGTAKAQISYGIPVQGKCTPQTCPPNGPVASVFQGVQGVIQGVCTDRTCRPPAATAFTYEPKTATFIQNPASFTVASASASCQTSKFAEFGTERPHPIRDSLKRLFGGVRGQCGGNGGIFARLGSGCSCR